MSDFILVHRDRLISCDLRSSPWLLAIPTQRCWFKNERDALQSLSLRTRRLTSKGVCDHRTQICILVQLQLWGVFVLSFITVAVVTGMIPLRDSPESSASIVTLVQCISKWLQTHFFWKHFIYIMIVCLISTLFLHSMSKAKSWRRAFPWFSDGKCPLSFEP